MYKLRMNTMKCAFRVSTGKFLGFIIHHIGISVDPTKAMTIATMKRPTMIKELKRLLGMVSYIKRFVPGLASVISELSKLLKKGAEFTWRIEQQEAFQDPADHKSFAYLASTNTWATSVAIFSIKFPGYRSLTSVGR